MADYSGLALSTIELLESVEYWLADVVGDKELAHRYARAALISVSDSREFEYVYLPAFREKVDEFLSSSENPVDKWQHVAVKLKAIIKQSLTDQKVELCNLDAFARRIVCEIAAYGGGRIVFIPIQRRIRQEQRRERGMAMLKEGASYAEIGKALGMSGAYLRALLR